MLQGQKKDRRTVFDPTVRAARKAVHFGKTKKAARKLSHQNLYRELGELA
jgi:hypothetical protein